MRSKIELINHSSLIRLVEKTEKLELWLIGSSIKKNLLANDIDFVIIGEDQAFRSIQGVVHKLEYPIPFSVFFINLNEIPEVPRYLMKDFIIYNSLSFESIRLSKNLFNLNFKRPSFSEIQFARLFHVTLELNLWKKTGKLNSTKNTFETNLMSLTLSNFEYCVQKQSILSQVENSIFEVVSKFESYEDYYNFAKKYSLNVFNIELEEVDRNDLDILTLRGIKNNFPHWLKHGVDLNIVVKEFVKDFYKI